MEILSTVVNEIIICLLLAWILGFLVAWMVFRKAANNYNQEIEELEENLSYSAACNRNQEKEIIRQAQEIEKLEKLVTTKKDQSEKEEKSVDKSLKKEAPVKSKKPVARSQKELDMLKSIEDNLYSVY